MNIKQSIFLGSFIIIFNLNGMLNKLTSQTAQHFGSKQIITQYLQKMSYSNTIQQTKKSSRYEKAKKTGLTVAAVPAGYIFGSPAGLVAGITLARYVGDISNAILQKDNIEEINEIIVKPGAFIGGISGGLLIAKLIGGVPGAVAWSASTLLLYAGIKFKDKVNKKR